jgi:hypothetical protein
VIIKESGCFGGAQMERSTRSLGPKRENKNKKREKGAENMNDSTKNQ